MQLKNGDTIIFAGDSTTDADKTKTGDGLGNGYVRLIRDALVAFCPMNHFRILNVGVGGNTSSQLLSRWDADVASHDPDIVFCMIGINDVWRQFDYLDPPSKWISEEMYEANIAQICEKAKPVREFYLMTPYYMERNRTDEMRSMTERYAVRLNAVAKRYGVKVIDLQKVFDKYMEYRPGQSISWDRVHPGAFGSMLIAREILKEMSVKGI